MLLRTWGEKKKGCLRQQGLSVKRKSGWEEGERVFLSTDGIKGDISFFLKKEEWAVRTIVTGIGDRWESSARGYIKIIGLIRGGGNIVLCRGGRTRV